MVKERYELPAFSTLDRLVLHIRAVINNRLFRKVARSLSVTEISYLDSLLINDPDSDSVTLKEVKQLPKKATLIQIKKLLAKFELLMAFGDAKRLFSTIATTKIKHFAAREPNGSPVVEDDELQVGFWVRVFLPKTRRSVCAAPEP